MSTLPLHFIGSDHDFAYPLDATSAHDSTLGGCVRSSNKVYNYLTAHVGTSPQTSSKRTAALAASAPQKPETLWPTDHNHIVAFEPLTRRFQPDDPLYIHAAGMVVARAPCSPL